MCTTAAPALVLLENPCPRGIAVDGALWLQAPRRGRQAVGILELARAMRAVRETGFVGNVCDGAVRVFDEPVRVPHAQLAVEGSRPHTDVLPAQALELTRGQTELRRHGRDRDGARQVLLHEQQRT